MMNVHQHAEKTMYRIVKLIDIVVVDESQPLFCDTETCGFYGKVRLLQCYQKDWKHVLLVEWPNSIQLAAFIIKHYTIWHNSHYDITTAQQQTGTRFVPEKFDDTFLAARIAKPYWMEFSLDAAITSVIGYDPYNKAGLNKSILQKSDWSSPSLTKDQLLYAALDVKYMPEVWEAVKSAIETPVYQLDMSSLRIALDFQWNGMPVDSERLNAEYTRISKELAAIPMPINANSWQQVRKWLNVEQSDKKFLSELALRGNDKARAVLDVRTRSKLLSFLTKYDVERVIGKFKPSARSGRFTSSDENLQQIPRALKVVFGYPVDSDRILIYSDYAQLELRTICAILAIKLMEEMFRKGVDLHGFVASVLFGEDWTKKDRQVTKTYNFNLLYGGSVGMVLSILITYGLLIEERLATRHKRKWLSLFGEINKWQQKEISAWRRGELGSTPFGRKYVGNLMTDQMNIMNQGAGAEVAKLALHYFAPWLANYNKECNTDVMIGDFIHDSFIIDATNDPEVYKAVAIKLAECMQEAWVEMSKLYKIKDLPMPVDVAVGFNWGDIEDDDCANVWDYHLDGMVMYDRLNTGISK
jgi:DNA polymerase I-like protein with 3'-5' exonuclease and polymerase domains